MGITTVGIFGGTFDPIHNGHLNIASLIKQQAALTHIEFVPTYLPPHRDAPKASPNQRLTMLKLALADYPSFSINDCELVRQGVSYTIDTVKTLTRQESLSANHPQKKYVLILSMDGFNSFNQWKDWQHICELVDVIVANRANYHFDNAAWQQNLLQKGKITLLNLPPQDYSATAIRHSIKNNECVVDKLPAKVLDYIQKQKLYR